MSNSSKPPPFTFSNRVVFLLLTLGFGLRLFVFSTESLRKWLQNRVEISTPLTSWNRVLEGIYLLDSSSTYDGDLVHETPLMLRLYKWLLPAHSPALLGYAFIVADLLTALLVHRLAHKCCTYFFDLELVNLNAGKYKRLLDTVVDDASEDRVGKFLLSGKNFNPEFWSVFTLAVYLLNPFCLASCVALSTATVHNLLLVFWLYTLLDARAELSWLFLALHANTSVYTAALVVPSIAFLWQKCNYVERYKGLSEEHTLKAIKSPKDNDKKCLVTFTLKHVVMFLAFLFAIFAVNLYLENFNTRFIKCTYLFVLQVPEMEPNLGVFWYFFTEMFDHFRVFFIYVFQLNVFIYTWPLTLRLKDDPIVSLFIQIGLISILKSYPNLGETGLYMSLLPICAYLFPFMRNFLVYSCMLLASTVLAPIMFYLWLGSGGGNANFYFAITLVFSIGQVFLLVDVLYANCKREFIKLNGPNIPKNKDNTLSLFTLE